MSTRSTISKLNDGGTITAVYCHSDGYPSYNGKMLLEHYTDSKKVDDLLSHGDMSFLAENVSPPKGVEHSFENPHNNTVVFYGRDRGETDTEPKQHKDIADFKDFWGDSWCEWAYMFKDGKWYFTDFKWNEKNKNYTINDFKLLTLNDTKE